VTVTETVPAACAGDVTVIDVELLTVTLVPAVPPKLTVAPEIKFVPVIVMVSPPEVVPDVGERLVMVGVRGAGVTYV
jgi:hypothetical protein